MERHGLIIVHTGKGKGKTTAALGLAIRAWGDGLRVLILQFIKGAWTYGEIKAIEALRTVSENIELRRCGLGFSRRDKEKLEQHREAAKEALRQAEQAIVGESWDMVILDEFNYAVSFGLVSVEEALALIGKKPEAMHLVLTGRDAAPEIVETADLVTEMKLVKHPFAKGIKAQKGIEF